MTPDQYRREGAEAMRERAAQILNHYDEYDRQLCCDGQMCGCQGSTVHQMIQHFIRAIDVDETLSGIPTAPDTKAIRAQMEALAGFTVGPSFYHSDLPSVEPNWHIATTENKMRALANVHIEPGNAMDVANASLIAATTDMRDTILALSDEVDRLRCRIENAGQAASETHPSWERRCYAITAALGFDYGEPTPDIPEQSGWYACKMKQMEDETKRLRSENERLRAALQPFADYMHTDEGRLDLDHAGCELLDDLGVGWIYLNHGDFRRAQAALAACNGVRDE